jgi:hypothetical protein
MWIVHEEFTCLFAFKSHIHSIETHRIIDGNCIHKWRNRGNWRLPIILLDNLMKRQVGKPGKQRLEPTEFGNFFPICSGRILFNRSKDSQSYIAIVIVAFDAALHCRHYYL